MIPTQWTAYRRPTDDELVGYLAADGELAVPLTVFGAPLSEAIDRDEAVALLEREGLACLAERWLLCRDDGEEVTVAILSAFPDRVELIRTQYGIYSHDSERYTLSVPAPSLRRAS